MKIAKTGGNLPSRVVYYGLPGVGKTSFAAHAPNPFFVLIRGETGLKTLIDNGIVQPTDHTEEPVQNLSEFKEAINWLLKEQHNYKTLVIDALTGLEAVIFDYMIDKHYDGSKVKFDAYGAGPNASVDLVQEIFDTLDNLRSKRKMGIILLAHSKVGKFNNPEGTNHNCYKVDCEDKTWGVVNKWADMVLFAKRIIYTDKSKNELGKVIGRTGSMVLHTRGTAAYDAKNRINLPEQIDLGDTPKDAWNAFVTAVKEGRRYTEELKAREAQQNTTTESVS